MEESNILTEVRCKCCHALLFKGAVKAVEIKCRKCGIVNTIAEPPKAAYGEYIDGEPVIR